MSIENRCSNCGEPADPILLTITASNGSVIATFDAEESALLLQTSIHHLLSSVIAPMARRFEAVNKDSYAQEV